MEQKNKVAINPSGAFFSRFIFSQDVYFDKQFK